MPRVARPTDAARAARGKRVGIEEREDGSLSFWHGEHALLAAAFPKEHRVQGEVVENKRLSATIELIKERQREREGCEAVHDPAEGPPAARRSAAADPSEFLRRDRTVTDGTGKADISILEKTGHLYFGPTRWQNHPFLVGRSATPESYQAAPA
jgi:hypothetical protein